MPELPFFPLTPTIKVFPDEPVREEWTRSQFEGFQNETISFQAAFCGMAEYDRRPVVLRAESPLKKQIRIRTVLSVPVRLAALPGADDNYLRKTPGLYPDLLRDQQPENPLAILRVQTEQWQSFWIDVEPEDECEPGVYPVELRLVTADDETVLASASISVTILPGRLPAQILIRTHWFHTDCLAEYYRVPVFSEEHWTIIENFIRTAVRRGCTMILTPLFTPPLDTAPGGERLTVQLVDVNVCKGAYTFGFDRLERWVEICRRCGVAYLEMSHLFTQWGAAAAPKIIATVDGEEKRLFGWETDAHGEAYAHFLSEFLPALMKKLNELGVAERAYFHISDEPSLDHLESYRHACSLVKPYLQRRPVIDALSDFAFYQTGALEKPIVAIDHLEPFLQAGVPGLWTYYCVGQYRDVTNSFMAMPAARTRMLGVQLYRYQLEGFLQWGYNFYHTQLSLANLNPYEVTDAGGVFPSGDAFQVYPGRDGKPEESIRFMLNHLAMQDLRALEALETLQGREQVLRLLEECAQGPLTLTDYPRDAAFFDRLRQRVNKELSGRL